MAAIDIVILILLGLGAYEGYRKGLLLSIVGLIGFVLAIILGVYFMDPVSKWLATKLDELTFAFPIMAFLIVFAITLLFVQIVGWILKKLMDLVLLGGLDSLAGALLGIVKTGFFLSLFLWLSLLFDLQMPKDWKNDSQYLGYIEPLAPSVIGILEPIFPKVKEVISNIGEIVEGFRDKADLI